MRRLLLTALLAGLAALPALAQEKKIALTFNDLPGRGPYGFWRPREVSNMILRALEEKKAPAAGFVVQQKIDEDPMLLVVLHDWADRGFTLGNQTHSRVDYNALGYDDFMDHVRDGQKDTRRLARVKNIPYRFLRFPQLHYGNSERKVERIRKTLRRAGYAIAHVSVKTADHQFIRAYLEHEGDSQAMARIKRLFLAHVNQSLEYSEGQSKKVFGRNIRHILLLRSGIATAMFLGDLIDFLAEKGYSFITLQKALEDEAYQVEDEYYGEEGLTFIDRVAATRGLSYDPRQGDLGRDDVQRWLREMEAEGKPDDSR